MTEQQETPYTRIIEQTKSGVPPVIAKRDVSETTFVECDCHSHSHTMRFFIIDWGDGTYSAGVDLALNHHRPWYKRIWPALQYVFGHRSADYVEALVAREQVGKVLDWAKKVNGLNLPNGAEI